MKHPDYDRAFHETPDSVRSAIELGFLKGRKRMRARHALTRALTVAAAFAVLLGAGVYGVSRLARPALPTPLEGGRSASATPSPRPASATPTPCPVAPTPTPRPAEATPAPTREVEAAWGEGESAAPAVPALDAPEEDVGEVVADEPARTPSPAPTPEPTPELTLEPTPAPSAFSEVSARAADLPLVYLRVRCDEGADPYFHLADGEGGALPEELDLATALWKGLTPCPNCVEGRGYRLLVFHVEDADEVSVQDGLWCTEHGSYLHVDSTCSGMANARKRGIAEAFASGKRFCLVCMEDWTCALALEDPAAEPALARALRGEQVETATDAGILSEPWEVESVEATVAEVELNAVYFTEDGRNFHGAPDCSVLIAEEGGALSAERSVLSAMEGSAADAVRAGKEPCPECLASGWSAVIVNTRLYYRPGDERFHRDASCGGERFEATVPLRTALEQGMLPCERCLGDPDYRLLVFRAKSGQTEQLRALWYTENGSYFHTCDNCSGMRGAEAHELSGAFRSGKRPCPVCLADFEFAVVRDVRTRAGAAAEYAVKLGGETEYQIAVSGAASEEVSDAGKEGEALP